MYFTGKFYCLVAEFVCIYSIAVFLILVFFFFSLSFAVSRFYHSFQLFVFSLVFSYSFFFTRFSYSFFRVSVIRFFSRFQFFFSFSLVINLKAGASVDGVMEEPRPREPRSAVLAVDGRALSPGARWVPRPCITLTCSYYPHTILSLAGRPSVDQHVCVFPCFLFTMALSRWCLFARWCSGIFFFFFFEGLFLISLFFT